MILFMLLSAVALFGKMFKLIAVSALQLAKVSAIVRSVSAPVASLTDHGSNVFGDPIQKMLGLYDRDVGLMGPMQGLIFFVFVPPIIFIFEFALEMDNAKGVVRFIGHEICLNFIL